MAIHVVIEHAGAGNYRQIITGNKVNEARKADYHNRHVIASRTSTQSVAGIKQGFKLHDARASSLSAVGGGRLL